MAREPRGIERVDFEIGDLAKIVERMDQLVRAGDGWINLVPKITEDDERPTSLRFFTLFGGGSTGITMCTWIPPHDDRAQSPTASLGITHLTGRRVVAELQTRDLPIPTNWFVEQDHPRRGLVVRIPRDAVNGEVLSWAINAVNALSPPSPLREWRADVYLPLG